MSYETFFSVLGKRHESAEHNWSFHGVSCTKEQAEKWKKLKLSGKCPWCGACKSDQYGGMNRHLRSCKDKPKMLDNVTTLDTLPRMYETMIDTYLDQCRVKNTLVEDTQPHYPPTPEETKALISYLKGKGLKPAIVGSVGILRHLGDVDVRKDFRPTVDLDVWVTKVPDLPPGWKRDRESVGVHSWISPSGGVVDFLEAGQMLAGDTKVPRTIEYDDTSASSEYPVASWLTILRMKLNSVREKDLADSLSLIRKMGRCPSPAELGALNQTQRENLDLLKQWYALRPKGRYGESA